MIGISTAIFVLATKGPSNLTPTPSLHASSGMASKRKDVWLDVGYKEVDAGRLKPYHNYFSVVHILPDGTTQNIGFMDDQLDEVMLESAKAWKRTQTTRRVTGQSSITTNVFDRTTASPFSSDVTGSGGQYFRRTFNGTSIKRDSKLLQASQTAWTSKLPLGEVEHVEATLDAPVFDFAGGMYGLLLACFPLEEGYKATFPFVAQFDEKYQTAHAEVVGKEEIHTPSGDFETFKVVVTQPAGVLTTWVSKEAPYLIRIDASAPTWGHTRFEIAAKQ